MSQVVKKLYYDILYTVATQPNARAIKFVAGTGQDFGSAAGVVGINGVDKDAYENVMAPNAFNGATLSLGAQTRQAVRAWVQCANVTDNSGVFNGAAPGVCADFIAPQADDSSAAIAAAATIDPSQVRRPWLRLRKQFTLTTTDEAVRLRVYVERQHSIEV